MARSTDKESLDRFAQEARAQREKLASDPQRPKYHFLPPSNWMNDPNGLIQWQGTYHLFYQYNPNGPFWGTMHWGHAVSADLVRWTDLPIALAPDPSSVDEDGCFSGCAVDNDGTPTFVYTGVQGRRQLPCIATGSDDLLTWTKYPGNPVIAAPPAELDLVAFRDHSVWREDGMWYQVIGSGITGVGGTALLYRSPDLIHWEYMHPLYVGDERQDEPVWTGPMWECPDFFPLGDKHVLVVSVWGHRRIHQHPDEQHRTNYTVYFVGTYVDYRFTPESCHKLDFGDNHFYAPQSLLDDRGRRIMWGWIQEGWSKAAQMEAGWSGVMSLPRVLGLRPDGMLTVAPAPALEVLRSQHRRWAEVEVTPSSRDMLSDVRGDALEMVAEWQIADARELGIKVRCSPNGDEQTSIGYNRDDRRLYVDRERSSLSDQVQRDIREGVLELAPDEPLQLRIFVDRSVIEVFANGRACLTSRIYPARPDSLGVDLFARDGTAYLRSLDVWEMGSIWGDGI